MGPFSISTKYASETMKYRIERFNKFEQEHEESFKAVFQAFKSGFKIVLSMNEMFDHFGLHYREKGVYGPSPVKDLGIDHYEAHIRVSWAVEGSKPNDTIYYGKPLRPVYVKQLASMGVLHLEQFGTWCDIEEWQEVRLKAIFDSWKDANVVFCPECGHYVEYDAEDEADGCQYDWAVTRYWSVCCVGDEDNGIEGCGYFKHGSKVVRTGGYY